VALRVGPPTKDTFMGPLLSEARLKRYRDRLAAAKHQGAEPLRAPERLELPGHFISPSLHLVQKRQPESDYQREELFGPDLAVYPIVDIDDALQLADAGPYGLCASLFTESPQRWRRFCEELRAGSLLWNRGTASPSGRMPFGGVKASGYGGRGGADAMAALRREVSLLGRTSEHIEPLPGTELVSPAPPTGNEVPQ
jgi:acyl-CoA reductase-like NAD-dependent aldehyde dehydrogenase